MVTPEMSDLPVHRTSASTDTVWSDDAFRVPNSMMRQVIAHLESALPHEGCGLLAVPAGVDWPGEAVKFYPGTNADRSSTRFTMDPAEVLAAFKEMRFSDWELGAIVHSHPASPPIPSPTDLREAYYPDALMLIVSFAGPIPEARAWRISGDPGDRQFAECPLSIE
jgi:proteasome lid subunit RPN8/RPN11